jgi:phage major head subunit gpT-like protein
MDITASNLNIIFQQASMQYQAVLTQTPTWYQDIASIMPSSSRQVVYGWLDRLPIMRKWLGNRQINAATTHSRTVINDEYEDTVALYRPDVRDDQLGVFNNAVMMLAEATKKWPDQRLAQFLRDAAVTNGFDGVPVYSTSHPLLGGDVVGGAPGGTAVQSNLLVNTALTFDNYITVRTAIMALKGADGQPLGIVPNLLIHPPQLEGTAKLILEGDFLPNTAGTAPQSNTYKGTAQRLMIPELADKPNNWWLCCTSKVIKPYLWQLREAPSFTYLVNPNDPNVFLTNQFMYGAHSSGAAAETVWWLSFAATASGTY